MADVTVPYNHPSDMNSANPSPVDFDGDTKNQPGQDDANSYGFNKKLRLIKVVQITYGVISLIFLIFYMLAIFVGLAFSIEGGSKIGLVGTMILIVTPILLVINGFGEIIISANITQPSTSLKRSLAWLIAFNAVSCLLVFPLSLIWVFPLVLTSLTYRKVVKAEIQQA